MDILVIVIFLWILLLIGKSYIRSSAFKGKQGERMINRQLRKLKKSEYVYIHDLYLLHRDRTVQIDHVVLSIYGVFVIETKNMKGIIQGRENDQNWLQILYKHKNNLYNPIRQNYGHVKTIEEYLENFGFFFDTHSIIVFPNDTKLQVDSEKVMAYKRLIRYIKGFKQPKYAWEDVESAYRILSEANITDKGVRKRHIKQVKNIVKEKRKQQG